MNKKIMYKILSISVVSLMLVNTAAYAAVPVKKDESVYVTLTSEGSEKDIIVSDWLHCESAINEVKDYSELKDIVNVKGDETPKAEGNNIIWESDKQDIFYQGTTDKKLPIEVSVRYFLDDKEAKPEDIVGKSGKIKIRLEVKNKDKRKVDVNGKKQFVYTPFTVVSVLNLPVDTFSNVKSNIGDVISDGNNQAIAFVCFPGLKESLNLKSDVVNSPEYLEVTADAKKFTMKPIMITATPNLPDVDAFKNAKNANELIDGINKLKDAASQLSDATGKISSGNRVLADNIGNLKNGTDKLHAASGELKNGADKLNNGLKEAQVGAGAVSNGAQALTDGTLKLAGAAEEFGKGAEDYSKGANDFANGAEKTASGVGELAEKSGELSNGLNGIVTGTEQIKNGTVQLSEGAGKSLQAVAKLRAGKQREMNVVELLIKGNDGLLKAAEELQKVPVVKVLADKMYEGLAKQKEGLMGLKDLGQQFIAGLDELQNGIESMKSASDKLTTGLNSLQDNQKKAASGAGQLAEGAKALKPAADGLKDGSKGLNEGAKKLEAGAKGLNEGAKQIKVNSTELAAGSTKVTQGLSQLQIGSSALSQGLTKFDGGLNDLSKGTSQLFDGANKLADGSKELDDKIKSFSSNGSSKESEEMVNKLSDVQNIIDTKDALINLSENYGTFTGIEKDMDGTVKFIMKTDEIKLPQVEKQDDKSVSDEDSKGFFSWLKHLFHK